MALSLVEIMRSYETRMRQLESAKADQAAAAARRQERQDAVARAKLSEQPPESAPSAPAAEEGDR